MIVQSSSPPPAMAQAGAAASSTAAIKAPARRSMLPPRIAWRGRTKAGRANRLLLLTRGRGRAAIDVGVRALVGRLAMGADGGAAAVHAAAAGRTARGHAGIGAVLRRADRARAIGLGRVRQLGLRRRALAMATMLHRLLLLGHARGGYATGG